MKTIKMSCLSSYLWEEDEPMRDNNSLVYWHSWLQIRMEVFLISLEKNGTQVPVSLISPQKKQKKNMLRYSLEGHCRGSSNVEEKNVCTFFREILLCCYYSGPSCSKLTMSLSLNIAYTLIFFAEKMWVAFALAKATHIFSQQKHMLIWYCTY